MLGEGERAFQLHEVTLQSREWTRPPSFFFDFESAEQHEDSQMTRRMDHCNDFRGSFNSGRSVLLRAARRTRRRVTSPSDIASAPVPY